MMTMELLYGARLSLQAMLFEAADKSASGQTERAGGFGLIASGCRQSADQLIALATIKLLSLRL
jgi:hypothetical protein